MLALAMPSVRLVEFSSIQQFNEPIKREQSNACIGYAEREACRIFNNSTHSTSTNYEKFKQVKQVKHRFLREKCSLYYIYYN